MEQGRTVVLDCGGTTPLYFDATRRVVPKRGHVRALQKEFTTVAADAFERELEQLYPDNDHVKENPVHKNTGQEFAGNCKCCVTRTF
jgi:hypothetical protein